ncbi:GrpB family protein [Vibrio sp. MMH1-50]|uniref:GrpB family protein n=1 Tax=Vibrio sp. MMH1-50 TaxID=2917764 RepID=UPI001EF1C8A4|nr:GrpB family protein [Vibrio harveyi]MCG7517934.1 GrpB family protein [Vibrio sp. MMH1-50]
MDKTQLIKRLEELGIGLERFTVQLTDYVHKWSEAYDLIVSVIAPNLNGVTIYHIGSTAIPGSIAKPIIDIGIAYNDTLTFKQNILVLESLGFTCKGEQGVEGRCFFTYYNDNERFDYIHVHAYKQGDSKLRKHIQFRDAHIQNQELLIEYNSLKQGLVASGVSRQDYPAAKAAYIQRILSPTS